MENDRFKVIIAGGGPVALTLAHALVKADIDFVILEQAQTITKDTGAGVGMGPGVLRVIKQFGFYESFVKSGVEVTGRTWFTPEGNAFAHQPFFFKYVKKNHGHGPIICNRSDILRRFYDALPEDAKAKVLLDKKVTRVDADKHGVSVTCADGSTHRGHLLVGCDGTHSAVRSAMRRRAIEEDPRNEARWDAEQPFLSTYRCMWGSMRQKCPPDYASETCSKDRSAMHYVGLDDRAWIFLYEKLDAPTSGRVRFSPDDALAFKDRFADWALHPDYRVGDFTKDDMISFGASLLEEGCCKRWFHGRIVLAGDAAHKVCPQAGMGLNDGVQDAVCIANKLNKIVSAKRGKQAGQAGHGLPSTAELSPLLQAYQDERIKEMEMSLSTSAAYARWQAFANPFYYFLGRYVVCSQFMTYVMHNLIAPKTFCRFLTLNYVETEEPFKTAVPWLYPIDGGKRPDV
ncbi:6-hydroxynicotinate 3-monooxygenase [Escovopsis weberi]|uniref:6-hydroxynicotinate 3-monooxygenase n=1 Tax=Escovopsis weberi TaxID=150374 RepID=A0A0M8MWR4_ESCWE|nr:6-hydroxynicotinate 3-monooxygenase [Escovopsis weberi]